ncbi:MAG: response regulator [Nitrospirae bacterium]|nr:response regulator [Nitrospirota bacterium]MBI4838858.1 response regulator [Nitrospirota bacterium]
MEHKNKGVVLVVDDDALVLDSISVLLKTYSYSVVSSSNAADAIEKFQAGKIDVVLTDIKMPGLSGIELLRRLHIINADAPVILMTAYAELDTAVSGIKYDAFDFIVKPFNPEYLLHSIEKAIRYSSLVYSEKNYRQLLENTVRHRTQELANALTLVRDVSRELIQRLTSVAEFRDTATGTHISRIGLYANKIAEALDLPMNFIETVTFASQMHDIGKIGIPDYILLKPAALTAEEFEIMKTHTVIGKRILADSSYTDIQMSASIALNHHEKWDGTGYPNGLKGETIPLEGRIVIICDQYDALRSERPYKPPFSHEKTFKIITEGDGKTMPKHFDPKVLNAFMQLADTFDEIFSLHP